MQMPGRKFNGGDYRYGYQGQEQDNEIKGEGNSVNYKYRMHDPRLGRFFAVDPLAPYYPHYSPYSFSGNRVIDMIELEGLEPIRPNNFRRNRAALRRVSSSYNREANSWRQTHRRKALIDAESVRKNAQIELNNIAERLPKLLLNTSSNPSEGQSTHDRRAESMKLLGKALKVIDKSTEAEEEAIIETHTSSVQKLTGAHYNFDIKTNIELGKIQTEYNELLSEEARGEISQEKWNEFTPLQKSFRQWLAKERLGPSPLDKVNEVMDKSKEETKDPEIIIEVLPTISAG